MAQTHRRTFWLQEVLAGLAAASGVGYVATAYSVSRWLTRTSPGIPLETPAERGLPWEPLECRTSDNLRLQGWLVTPPHPRATIALFHGLRHNRTQTLSRIEFLADAGFRCVAFDHRAHGASDGKRSSFGFHESRDVIAVLDLIRREWPRQPLAALGISMGAAALCYAAEQTRTLDAVILEGLYHDLASAFHNRIGTGYPRWFKRFTRGVIWVTERRLRLRLRQLTPAEYIAALGQVPVLLVTGSEDAHAPPEDAERLFARCRGPRELYVVEGAGHRDVCEVGGQDYRRRVLAFLERQLAAAAALRA